MIIAKLHHYGRFVFFLLLLSVSVIRHKAQAEGNTPKRFHYVIMGKVHKGNGIKVSLYIPAEGMDNRKTVTIKKGIFKFEGYSNYIQPASIFFEKAEVRFKGVRENLNLFLEKDTVIFEFKVKKDRYAWYLYDDLQVLKGNVNKFYRTSEKEYYKETSYRINADPKIQDSLQKYVYPEIRKKILDSYEKLYYNCNYDAVALFMLKNITGGGTLFKKSTITNNEKNRLLKFFNAIDTTLRQSGDYKTVKERIEQLTSPSKKSSIQIVSYDLIDKNGNITPEFKNFTLIDDDGKLISIEQIVRNNKITILDFWWTGCGPCRKFNKETANDYNYLKSKGIEIISVNCDKGKDSWMVSSKKDGITWINLYAGSKSEIINYFKIKKYPTMFVFDKNLKLVQNYSSNANYVLKYLDE